uniref:hypothetical protein n=1 Tax=Marinobacterium profundum TaxID=1714300 RepID=UPI000835BB26|nr:hypothetical protein [Marinobacterium profundum]
MAQYQVERIRNGLIVTDTEGKTYYKSFDDLIAGLTEDMKERYQQSTHFGGVEKFTLTLAAEGI